MVVGPDWVIEDSRSRARACAIRIVPGFLSSTCAAHRTRAPPPREARAVPVPRGSIWRTPVGRGELPLQSSVCRVVLPRQPPARPRWPPHLDDGGHRCDTPRTLRCEEYQRATRSKPAPSQRKRSMRCKARTIVSLTASSAAGSDDVRRRATATRRGSDRRKIASHASASAIASRRTNSRMSSSSSMSLTTSMSARKWPSQKDYCPPKRYLNRTATTTTSSPAVAVSR